VQYESDHAGTVFEPRPAARFGAVTPPDPRSAPALGVHGDETLAAIGYSAEKILSLRAAGVLG